MIRRHRLAIRFANRSDLHLETDVLAMVTSQAELSGDARVRSIHPAGAAGRWSMITPESRPSHPGSGHRNGREVRTGGVNEDWEPSLEPPRIPRGGYGESLTGDSEEGVRSWSCGRQVGHPSVTTVIESPYDESLGNHNGDCRQSAMAPRHAGPCLTGPPGDVSGEPLAVPRNGPFGAVDSGHRVHLAGWRCDEMGHPGSHAVGCRSAVAHRDGQRVSADAQRED